MAVGRGWRWCRWGSIAASTVYVRNKRRSSLEAGIESFAHDLPANAGEAQILALVEALNRDARVDGILVQLPLPAGVDTNRVMDAVDPAKDVDGFHPLNTGLLAQKRPRLRPCTPYGVIRLAQEYGIALTGARATVVGASNIVGRPMALELLLARATVTVCHTGTRDLRAEVERAEVLVAAVGKAGFIPGEWIRPGRRGVRRRHQSHAAGDAGGGRGVRERRRARRLDHPGARRPGAHDHRDAAFQHAGCRIAAGRRRRLKPANNMSATPVQAWHASCSACAQHWCGAVVTGRACRGSSGGGYKLGRGDFQHVTDHCCR